MDGRKIVEVIGNHEIVHDHLEHLIDVSRPGQQAGLFQPFEDVGFSLALPGAFAGRGRSIRRSLAGILNRVWGIQEHASQLLFASGALQVVTPKASLRPEAKVRPAAVSEGGCFAIHVNRQAEGGLEVFPPTVKVKYEACLRAERPIEADDVVVAVFNPDASLEEPPFFDVRTRPQIKDQAAHLAQKLPANELELVVLAIEAADIEKNGRRKEAGLKLEGKEASQWPARKRLAQGSAFLLGAGKERPLDDALAHFEPPQEVVVTRDHRGTPFPVLTKLLDIGLDARAIFAEQLHQLALAGHDVVYNLRN